MLLLLKHTKANEKLRVNQALSERCVMYQKKEYNPLRLVANFTSGIPFIVMGQLVSVFLDQKELLEEISDSLKKK